LDTLAFLEILGQSASDKSRVAMLSGHTVESGYFKNSIGALRTARLVDYPQPSFVGLTNEGRALANTANAPQTNQQVHDLIRAKLSASQARIFDVLLGTYPKQVAKDWLAEQSMGSNAESGYFKNMIGAMRTMGVVTYPVPGAVCLSAHLFIEKGVAA
jgi:hypothetical protein